MAIKGKVPLEENPFGEWKEIVGENFICPFRLHIQSLSVFPLSIPFSWSLAEHFRYMPNTFGLCPDTAEVTAWRIQINHSVKNVWVRVSVSVPVPV